MKRKFSQDDPAKKHQLQPEEKAREKVPVREQQLDPEKSWIFEHDYCEGPTILEPEVIVKDEVDSNEVPCMELEVEESTQAMVMEPSGDEAKVLALLPPNYNYRFEKCEFVSTEHYVAAFRIKEVDTEEKADEWMGSYEEMGFTTWRVRKTFPGSGRVNVHKIEFRCQHNTDKRRGVSAKQRRTKDTNCQSILQLTVKRFIRKSQAKRKDLLIADWPCIINLFHVHNHSLGMPGLTPVRRLRKKKPETLHTVRYLDDLHVDENSSPVHQLGSEIEIAAAVGSCLKAIFPDSNYHIPPEADERLILDNYIITAVGDEGTLIHLPEQTLHGCSHCPCVEPCKCECHADRRSPPAATRDIGIQAGDPDLGVVVYNSSESSLIQLLRQVGWVQVQEAPI